MPNPTINVNLSSLDAGTVPTVTDSVEVQEGHELDVNVTWPSAGADAITCVLDFSNSGDQDPFNDEAGGSTSLNLNRTPPSQSASGSLTVQQDATVTTDTYDLTLNIGGQSYSTDPTIIIDPD